MSGRLRHWKSVFIAQAEGHYFIMVQHMWENTKNRDVMHMWKLGGSGLLLWPSCSPGANILFSVGCLMIVGVTWGHLGAILGHLGAILVSCSAILDHIGPSWGLGFRV